MVGDATAVRPRWPTACSVEDPAGMPNPREAPGASFHSSPDHLHRQDITMSGYKKMKCYNLMTGEFKAI
jgi:hypothetical protein